MKRCRRRHPISAPTTPSGDQADPELDQDELDVLRALATGATLTDIARDLHLGHRTVSRRLRDINRRLGVASSIQAVVWAVRRQLI